MPCPWRDYCSCVRVILAIIAIPGVIAFSSYSLIWVFVHPNEPKITITDASLTQFDFAAGRNNILNYNLALNSTIRNSNKRAGLDYHGIQVIGKYRNKKFFVASLSLTPFCQDHKNTTIVPGVLQGQQWVKFQKRDVSRFNSETACGWCLQHSCRVLSSDQIQTRQDIEENDRLDEDLLQASEGSIK